MPHAEQDICKDPLREDWSQLKSAFEAFAGAHEPKILKAEKLDEEEYATRTWFYQESSLAIRTIERVLNYEITYEEGLQVVRTSYLKIVATATRSARYREQKYITLAESIEYLSENLTASKIPNSPRLAYLQVARYLEEAAHGVSSIEGYDTYWELLGESHRVELRKHIRVLVGDRAAAKYEEKVEEVHECIYGAILIARKAAVTVTGCVTSERSELHYKHLRKVLNKIQLLYCRLLCLARNPGVGIQPGVSDNVHVSILGVARYLELAFRRFESIRVVEEDCSGDMRAAWTCLTQHISLLNAEIVRFTSTQATSYSASWQRSIASLSAYSQEATSLLVVQGGTSVAVTHNSTLRVMELTNLFDDELVKVWCLFVHQRGFRFEVFDAMWASLIQIRCALLCSCREAEEEAGSHEKQVKRFFEAFEFLKTSYAAAGDKAKAGQPQMDWASAGVQGASIGSTASSAPLGLATTSNLGGLWDKVTALITRSKSLSKRFDQNATGWLQAVNTEKQFVLTSSSQIATSSSLLTDRTLRVWRSIFSQMSVTLAVEKDAAAAAPRQDLDQFSADLNALNAQMFLALGQPLSTTAPAAAGVGAST